MSTPQSPPVDLTGTPPGRRTVLEDEHLYRMIEQSLVPSPNVRELDPDPIHAATARLGDAIGTVSERYQLDSMLTDAQMRRLPSAREAQATREYFFTSTTDGFDRLLGQRARWATTHPPGVLRRVLEPAWTDPTAVGALFAVDLLVVRDDVVWRQVPGRDGALLEQHLDAQDRRALAAAVPGGGADVELGHTVFAVGAFARAGYLYGKRAYRACALSAGLLLGAVVRAAAGASVRAGVVEQFVDHRLNAALANDGVDRGVVAVLRLAPPPPSPSPSPSPDTDRPGAVQPDERSAR